MSRTLLLERVFSLWRDMCCVYLYICIYGMYTRNKDDKDVAMHIYAIKMFTFLSHQLGSVPNKDMQTTPAFSFYQTFIKDAQCAESYP